ncbi:hypothetical protein KY327_01955 [Candidatus Woesearchaeota archaeon]|nr:hypothetical protein [Candidatus Woesearchaeota archaeon]
MTRIVIMPSLAKNISKTFSKAEAHEVIDRIEATAAQPRKGKTLGAVGGLLIKELKYKKYRLYFIVDHDQLRYYNQEGLAELLLMFVRMSDKKRQQDTIDEIKHILNKVGPSGLR